MFESNYQIFYKKYIKILKDVFGNFGECLFIY